MSILEWRGGIPAVKRLAALGTTVVKITVAETLRRLPEYQGGRSTGKGVSKFLYIHNHDTTNDLRVYFHEGDITAGNYILVPAHMASGGFGVWFGPAEVECIWVRADSGTVAHMDATFFLRRG